MIQQGLIARDDVIQEALSFIVPVFQVTGAISTQGCLRCSVSCLNTHLAQTF